MFSFTHESTHSTENPFFDNSFSYPEIQKRTSQQIEESNLSSLRSKFKEIKSDVKHIINWEYYKPLLPLLNEVKRNLHRIDYLLKNIFLLEDSEVNFQWEVYTEEKEVKVLLNSINQHYNVNVQWFCPKKNCHVGTPFSTKRIEIALLNSALYHISKALGIPINLNYYTSDNKVEILKNYQESLHVPLQHIYPSSSTVANKINELTNMTQEHTQLSAEYDSIKTNLIKGVKANLNAHFKKKYPRYSFEFACCLTTDTESIRIYSVNGYNPISDTWSTREKTPKFEVPPCTIQDVKSYCTFLSENIDMNVFLAY
ncbi:hypothetical protein bcgnr5372_27560 [Bacillus luti]